MSNLTTLLFIIIVSNAGGEGKTLLAQLIQALLQLAGEPVIMLDGDAGNKAAWVADDNAKVVGWGVDAIKATDILAATQGSHVILDLGANSLASAREIVDLVPALRKTYAGAGYRTIAFLPVSTNKLGAVAAIKALAPKIAGFEKVFVKVNRDGSRAFSGELEGNDVVEMGIVADPQEHLGTDQAAAETRGEATVIGCENESRQWDAIMAEGDARLEAVLMEIKTQTAIAGDRDQKDLADETAKRDQRAQAARLQHMAFCLEQDIGRARSRAAAVQRKNRQLLEAYNADPTAGTLRERTQAEQLVQAATRYLAHLDAALGDDLALPALARGAADQALRPIAVAGEAQQSPTKVSPLAPIYTHPERFSAISRDDAMIAEAMDKARRRDEERQSVAPTPTRSDRARAGEQSGATEERKPPHEGSTSELARDDAAKREAIAAALRGHGR